MGFDAGRNVLVLFGGLNANGKVERGDTWEYNPATAPASWTQRTTTGPAARDRHGMVCHVQRGRVVLFGGWDGSSHRSDLWEWNGTA